MIRTIIAKELRSLFASPLAWVILAFLQVILAWIFLTRMNFFLNVQGQLARMPNPPGLTEFVVVPMFGIASIVLMMSVPLLTMRLIAEERRNRTMTMLMSAPVSMTQIVLGKFLATAIFLAMVGGLITLMALSLLMGGKLDYGLLAANLLGLLLLTGSFAAVGLFVSCLTTHPVVAAIGALAAFLALWLVNIAASDPASPLHLFSLLKHFEGFVNGAIAVTDLIYFVLLTAVFLILSIRRLDADRLRA
jgi:ABC-2 type transport system permease protein